MIDFLSLIMLCLSIILSSGRNLLSKSVSAFSFGTASFYRLQTVIFACGAVVIALLGLKELQWASTQTLIYSVIYGCLLLSAQWCYTASLKNGNTSICATVYSLGFILPTLSGAVIFDEVLGTFEYFGIILAIAAVICSGMRGKGENNTAASKGYTLPLVIAMLSSGGLGIMQKLQQSSPFPEQRTVFVLTAFCLAAAVSFICSVSVKKQAEEKIPHSAIIRAGGTGACFGCCNVLNTILAGRLASVIFFPVQNIGTILLSLISGIIIFREKPGIKEICVLLLGISAVLLLSA